jgi:tryptophan-rich sensory protein
MQLFAFQLALNVLWSILFFGLRNPVYAGVEILILLAAIYKTRDKFAEIDLKATWLLMPYILWVIYAANLNWGIISLNFI